MTGQVGIFFRFDRSRRNVVTSRVCEAALVACRGNCRLHVAPLNPVDFMFGSWSTGLHRCLSQSTIVLWLPLGPYAGRGLRRAAQSGICFEVYADQSQPDFFSIHNMTDKLFANFGAAPRWPSQRSVKSADENLMFCRLNCSSWQSELGSG